MSKLVQLLVLSSFILSLVIVVPVFANGDGDRVNDRVQHRLDEAREKRDAAKARIEEKRQQAQQKRDELRDKAEERLEIAKQKIAERIKKIFAKVLRRLNAAISRLDGIAERIASRIDKLNERGVDTSAAEEALASAEILGAEADEAVSEAAAAIEAIDTTDLSVREAMNQAKSAISSAKDALKAYHKGLVGAIRELKASSDLREATQEAETDEE